MNAMSESIKLLRKSQDAYYSYFSVAEIISRLTAIQAEYENSGQLDNKELGLLFAPTGPIQETSIDNGWGYKFIELSKEIDSLVEE